jgi:hypothetical protein
MLGVAGALGEFIRSRSARSVSTEIRMIFGRALLAGCGEAVDCWENAGRPASSIQAAIMRDE